jgi:hypothetical protein
VGEAVEFRLYGTTAQPVTAHWTPEPKPELTSFVFLDASEDIPKLPVSIGERKLQLNLSDTCDQPLVPPRDMVLSFNTTSPLSVSATYSPDNPGQWLVSAKLPECPDDPAQPLVIRPTVNGSELSLPDGEKVERFVRARCASAVELSIHSPDNGTKVEPGAQVDFEVKLSNKGPQPILNGILMVSAEGLTVIEARLEGEPRPPESGGFVIPELLPGETVEVKLKTQATTNLEQIMNAKVWFVDADGAELTPQQAVDLTLGSLGVDVGCGCHAASLPSQLLPWLALLLAASRPWDRSRRLRRGERIDR